MRKKAVTSHTICRYSHTPKHYFTDSLVFNIPTGITITKQIDIENYRDGLMKVYHIEIRNQEIHIIDDIATVVATIQLKANYIDQLINGDFRFLRVWKLNDTGWKVIAGSSIEIQ